MNEADRLRILAVLQDLARRDDEVRRTCQIICAAENVQGIAQLSDEQLDLCYDAALDMVEQLREDGL